VVRTAEQIQRLVESNPYPEAAGQRPEAAARALPGRRSAPPAAERVHADELTRDVVRIIGEDMYVDYVDAVHGTKLTPISRDAWAWKAQRATGGRYSPWPR
jgi:uncharacterized protein (DUF1697 family)